MEYKSRMADNRFNFYKFMIAANDRAGALERIAKTSEDILSVINKELGPEKKRVAEINFLHSYLEERPDRSLIREIFTEYFKEYSLEEFERMVEEWDNDRQNAQSSE